MTPDMQERSYFPLFFLFAQIDQAFDLGAATVGATIYSGRKAFQRPMDKNIELPHTIQEVYRNQG